MSGHKRYVAAIAVAITAVSAGLLGWSSNRTATPAEGLSVNFQSQTASTPAGFDADFGQAFDPTRGYGWETPTGKPLSMVGNGVKRKALTDQRLDTVMPLQLEPGSDGTVTEARWEAMVRNGTYKVTVSVGDPLSTDSHHVINVERVKVVDFTPTTDHRQVTVSKVVRVSDGRVTVDAVGGTNTVIASIVVRPPDVTAPTVDIATAGATDQDGRYLGAASLDIRGADSGSGVKEISYTLDGTRAQRYTSPLTVDVPGSHTVTATAVDDDGNASQVATTSFTVVTDPRPSLEVTTPEDDLGLGSRMVFSTVANESRPGHPLTIRNAGSQLLKVSAVKFSGPEGQDFGLCPGQRAELTLTAGRSARLCIAYRPTVDAKAKGPQVSKGLLTLSTNDPDGSAYPVSLGGLSTAQYEGDDEPSLQAIFDALGYPVNAGVSNRPKLNSIGGSSEPAGQEVLAPYFTRLDPTKKVSLVALAAYSNKTVRNSTRFGWYVKHSGTNRYLFQFPGGAATQGANSGYGQNQLLLPATTGSNSFDPSGAFGIVSQDGNHSDDALNFGAQQLHNIRTYPALDADRETIPGAWLVSIDALSPVRFSYKNWDYQDYVFLLLNARPTSTSSKPAGGLDQQRLLRFPGDAAGVSGSGFTSASGRTDASKIAFRDNRLRLTTSDDTDRDRTNALQLPVNGTTRFRLQAGLVGPFDAIDAGDEQQGIYLGIDPADYLKAVVDWSAADNARHLTVWRVTAGKRTRVKSIRLPAENVNTIDVRIDGDPSPSTPPDSAPTASVSYALNGSHEFTSVTGASTPVTIPADYVRSTIFAGLTASHHGGSQFVATYARFTAERR